MGQQLNMGSKVKTLAKATKLLKLNWKLLINKIIFDLLLILGKLLILDPKSGDLTMPRFVEPYGRKGIERVNVA